MFDHRVHDLLRLLSMVQQYSFFFKKAFDSFLFISVEYLSLVIKKANFRNDHNLFQQ